jgi:hypothetical protein
LAEVLSDNIRVISVDAPIIHMVLDIEKGERTIDVDDDDQQHAGQGQLLEV